MKASEIINRRILNWANLVTSLRVFLLIPLGYFLSREEWLREQGLDSKPAVWASLGFIILIVASDFFDGKIARHFHQKTRFGQYLDPVCDKISMFTAGAYLILFRDFPWQVMAFIILRDMLAVIFGSFLFFRRDVVAEPNIWGKLSVSFFSVSGTWYVIEPLLPLSFPDPVWSLFPLLFVQFMSIYHYISRYGGITWFPDRNQDIHEREKKRSDYKSFS